MAKRGPGKSVQSVSGERSPSGSGKAQTVQIQLPDIAASNYGNRASVFGSPCRFCGERFGRYSLPLHLRKCPHRDHVLVTHQRKLSRGEGTSALGKEASPLMRRSTETESVQMLSPLRTRTRSLERSVLVQRGFTLPVVECSTSPQLRRIGGEVTSNLLHQNNCRPTTRIIAKGKTTSPHVRHTQSPLNPPLQCSKKSFGGRPPTVLCYICGREYGSKSISIHEPQCLRKFELENKKLPIKDRKSLPQKPINHAAIVVPITVTSQGCTIHPPPTMATRGIYDNEAVLQDTAEHYFQYCYGEWEKDLIPCKTCGRTFAPERHAKHVHRCKAKPLPNSARH